MINGIELGDDEPLASIMPLSLGPSAIDVKWREARFPVRIVARLIDAIESRIPVGYEDQTGFHYGVKAS
jgi:hypothetical protein